jgi:hypothetical protein
MTVTDLEKKLCRCVQSVIKAEIQQQGLTVDQLASLLDWSRNEVDWFFDLPSWGIGTALHVVTSMGLELEIKSDDFNFKINVVRQKGAHDAKSNSARA